MPQHTMRLRITSCRAFVALLAAARTTAAAGLKTVVIEGGEEVRRRVMEHSNIALEWEIQRIGVDG